VARFACRVSWLTVTILVWLATSALMGNKSSNTWSPVATNLESHLLQHAKCQAIAMLPRSASACVGHSGLHNGRVLCCCKVAWNTLELTSGYSVMVNHARNVIERSDYRAFLVLFRNWRRYVPDYWFQYLGKYLCDFLSFLIWIIGGLGFSTA
jgi:hypothetical protein